MTAEIVIMNKSAIAMAADSAATLSNGKVYNGVNKLFQLSHKPPVGIMVYGSADCNSIPMETLIKEFRKTLADDNLTEISEFGKKLMDFIKVKCENYCNTDDYYSSIIKNIFFKFHNEYMKYQIEYKDENCSFLNYLDKKYSKENFHFDISMDNVELQDLDKVMEKTFQMGIALDFFDSEDEERIYEILKRYYISKILSSYTGIVIAGFDCEQLYPSYLSYHVLGSFNGEFIYKIDDEVSINNDNTAYIAPFAQSDVVETFLKGINSKNQKTILKFVNEFLNDFPEEIVNILEEAEILDSENLNKLKESIEDIKKPIIDRENAFNETLDELKDENYDPILSSIAHVPKEDLSNMCESLIHLTSLRRKISYDVESVGGEIDVAIISKGDGFIWTKRKHYFNSDLNPQFFENRGF